MTEQPSGRQSAAMAFGEPVVGGVQHKVVAVTHQPVGLHLGVEAVHRLGKHRQKCMSIPVVNKGQFAPASREVRWLITPGNSIRSGRDRRGAYAG